MRAGTRLAALEMIQSGTTTYADMYYFEEEIAQATKEAGLRGVLGQTIIQFPVADAKTPAEGMARAEAFIKQFANDDLIVPAIAPHSMYTLDAATLKEMRARRDARARAGDDSSGRDARRGQESRTSKYKATPTQFLESIGFWGPRTLAAHGVRLTPADMTILARRHVGVSHNPESNMKLASGTSPVLGAAARRRRRRPWHRRGGQQQRSRHVRGDAAGGVSAQAARPTIRARCRRGRRSGWRRSTARARSAWTGDRSLETGKRADLHRRFDDVARGRRRCTIPCRTSSTSRAATTCRRSSSMGGS